MGGAVRISSVKGSCVAAAVAGGYHAEPITSQPAEAPGVAPTGVRAGTADLPLHGGPVPKWLGNRMTRLGAVITEAIVLE